jgi:CheY-like chemotaxis protein
MAEAVRRHNSAARIDLVLLAVRHSDGDGFDLLRYLWANIRRPIDL